MSTVQKTAPKATIAGAHKSWVRRHKIFTALGVLLIAILVGGTIWAWPLMKLRFHGQYAAALAEIRGSQAVAERLGEPIDPVRPFPGGTAYDDGKKGEARLNFSVAGPKGTAEVAAVSTMMQGKWGFTQLKLSLANREEINLAEGIQKREGNDLPPFDPNVKQPDLPQPNLNIDITLPPLPDVPTK